MPDELSRNAARTFPTLLEVRRSVTRTKKEREFISSPETKKSEAAPNGKVTLVMASFLSIAAILASTSIGFGQTPAKPAPPSPMSLEEPSPHSRGALLDRNNTPIAVNDPTGKRNDPFGNSMAYVTGYIWKNS